MFDTPSHLTVLKLRVYGRDHYVTFNVPLTHKINYDVDITNSAQCKCVSYTSYHIANTSTIHVHGMMDGVDDKPIIINL